RRKKGNGSNGSGHHWSVIGPRLNGGTDRGSVQKRPSIQSIRISTDAGIAEAIRGRPVGRYSMPHLGSFRASFPAGQLVAAARLNADTLPADCNDRRDPLPA